MKIYCDFCGAQIETSLNKTCPNCGGYYSADEELVRERERVNKLNDLDAERKKLDIERMRIENQKLSTAGQDKKGSLAKGCLFAVVFTLALLGVLFVAIMVIVMADDAKGTTREKDVETTRSSLSHTVSIEPIDIPEIPEIRIPDITVDDIKVPEIKVQ